MTGSPEPGTSEGPFAGRSVAQPPADSRGGDFTFVELVNVVLRHWRTVALLPFSLAVVVGVYSLLQDRSYTASASFIPQGVEDRQSGLVELATRFGFTMSGRQDESPEFYADLLLSRDILRDLASTKYTFPTDAGTVTTTLIDLFGFDGTEEERSYRTIVELERQLTVTTDAATSVVEVSVTAGSSELAEEIIGRLIDLVNDFNLERRQSRAAEERLFVEGRLEEMRAELEEAEDALQEFLQQNRRFANSPELTFEYDRLARRVQMRQQVVTELTTAYEQARIAEVRNTPVITLVERPEGSSHPNPRRTILKVLLALILGSFLGVLMAFMREYVTRTRERGTEDVREFIALKDRMLRDLSRPLKGWRGREGTGTGSLSDGSP